MKRKVGVIGNGFVGESQVFAFSSKVEVMVYDIDPLKSTNKLEDLFACDFVFVCVPTPMGKDGVQDLKYIHSVFKELKPGPVYIIKSTVLPGTTNTLKSIYPGLDIVFSPEFLTERKAKLDMLTQSRIILGGIPKLTKKVKKLFEYLFKEGEKPRGLICLASGKVKVFKEGVGGRKQILKMVKRIMSGKKKLGNLVLMFLELHFHFLI